MPDSFSDLLISTFPGINDQVVAPTASKAGNGSHLIKAHNDLVNFLEGTVSPAYTILENSNDYSVSHAEKLIVFSNSGFSAINIILPSSPVPGTWFSVFCSNQSTVVDFLGYGKYQSGYPIRVYFQNEYKVITLIYINSDFGWMPDELEIIETEFDAS